MKNEDIKSLIKYRLEQAQTALHDAVHFVEAVTNYFTEKVKL